LLLQSSLPGCPNDSAFLLLQQPIRMVVVKAEQSLLFENIWVINHHTVVDNWGQHNACLNLGFFITEQDGTKDYRI